MAKGITIQPLGSKVLVQRVEAESTTAGGVILPDAAKDKPLRGTVLAVGEGRLLDSGETAPMRVKKDQKVLFTAYGGTEITVGREKQLIMDESDILAIIIE